MSTATVQKFEALERQARRVIGVFIDAGYEAVAPSIIQPAGVFLDAVGESLRARTYVFTDPDGQELCLRPDLTVPTCRLHLERQGAGSGPARYCYNGPAFRFQPPGADAAHRREFRQAGLELFAEPDRERADTEILTLVLEAVRAAGLAGYSIRIGDLGLFQVLLAALALPERWRQRLRRRFWQPDAFRTELERLAAPPAAVLAGLPKDIVSGLAGADRDGAERLIEDHLRRTGIELQGTRTLAEIADGLRSIMADAEAEPMPRATADLIERYLAVTGPARDAGPRIKNLMRERGIDVADALSAYHRRLQLLAEAGVDLDTVVFSADFGRAFAYYTGFVFEVLAPSLGTRSPVAGGGRYDDLLKAVGATADIPAVGAAIYTERLLSVVNGGGP